MTSAERVQAVVDYGFTERQARFLALVMRHAGLCVKRQYAAFAGVANGGEKCNAFFHKLIGRRFAVATECVHNRAMIYHVHHKALYHAIGEPDSRFRRPVSARSAAERLMRLDVALASPNLEWITTSAEKGALQREASGSESAGASKGFAAARDRAEQLPGTFPIGIDPGGRVVLLYLATVPWTDDFRKFLVGHVELLSVTRDWTLRLVFTQPLARAVDGYRAVVREELETPLEASTLYDLRRYFFHRRRGTDLNGIPEGLRAFIVGARERFAAPRFRHLYRRWLTEEEAVFTPISAAIPEALAAGRARIECVVLSHRYDHLSPLVARRDLRGRLAKREQRGDGAPRSINPSLNPAP